MASIPNLDPRIQVVCDRMKTLMLRPEVREAIDTLSADVLELTAEFFDQHGELITRIAPDVSESDVVAAVVGWILGFSGGTKKGRDAQTDETFTQIVIAAVVSGWSTGNTAAVMARSQH